MEIEISETVSLASLSLDEAWLQDRIWENPSSLGLGELECVSKEQSVSSGGKLDILLKNPIDDSMYEVEVMLGDTDPSHIIRTIEYWDLVKRRWPQRQHFAVLIAERITKRFFNVIQVLSGSVPLIAIQVNIIKSTTSQSLHFTKILDVYEEIDDGTVSEGGSYDEAYWASKGPELLHAARNLLEITNPVYQNARLAFTKGSINIVKDGYNLMVLRNRSGDNIYFEFRYGDSHEASMELLESNSIQYTDRARHLRFVSAASRIGSSPELFTEIAKLNKQWHRSDGE